MFPNNPEGRREPREEEEKELLGRLRLRAAEMYESLKRDHPKLANTAIERRFKYIVPLIALGAALAETTLRPHHPERDASAESRQRAEDDLSTRGITQERRATHLLGVSEFLERAVTPLQYQTLWDVARSVPDNVLTGRDDAEMYFNGVLRQHPQSSIEHREDAWSFYLGLPQHHDTFRISHYLPEGQETGYVYALNGWLDRLLQVHGDNEITQDGRTLISIEPVSLRDVISWRDLPDDQLPIGAIREGPNALLMNDIGLEGVEVMGNYHLRFKQDDRGPYIEYQDDWNLDKARLEGKDGFFGRPFTIYDRVYYDPKTFKLINETPSNTSRFPF